MYVREEVVQVKKKLHSPWTFNKTSHDKHVTRSLKVSSCNSLAIHAMVCNFNDMVWNCYAMLQDFYAMRNWHEKFNDMVCNNMQWDF